MKTCLILFMQLIFSLQQVFIIVSFFKKEDCFGKLRSNYELYELNEMHYTERNSSSVKYIKYLIHMWKRYCFTIFYNYLLRDSMQDTFLMKRHNCGWKGRSSKVRCVKTSLEFKLLIT